MVYNREAKEVFSSRDEIGENEGTDSRRCLKMPRMSDVRPGGPRSHTDKMPRVLDAAIPTGKCSSREQQPRLEASLHPRMQAHDDNQWERSGSDISIELNDGSSAGSSIVASLGTFSPDASTGWRHQTPSNVSLGSFVERLSSSTRSLSTYDSLSTGREMPRRSQSPHVLAVTPFSPGTPRKNVEFISHDHESLQKHQSKRQLMKSSLSSDFNSSLVTIMEGSSFVGPLFHCMISCWTNCEGEDTDGTVMQFYEKLLDISCQHDEAIPLGLHGEWPSEFPKPTMANGQKEHAIKVFMYSKSRMPDTFERWGTVTCGRGGLVQGMVKTLLFAPILSWCSNPSTGEAGSLGSLTDLMQPNDYVDNVLLELTLALEMFHHPSTKLQNIFPILIGDAMGHGSFKKRLLAKVQELSDDPSALTNQRAIIALKSIFLEPSPMLGKRSVKSVVLAILEHPGIELGQGPSVALETAAITLMRTIKTSLVDRSEKFDLATRKEGVYLFGAPQGKEVLEWLQRMGLPHLSSTLARCKLDSLASISKLCDRSAIERLLVLESMQRSDSPTGSPVASLEAKKISSQNDVDAFAAAINSLKMDLLSKSLTHRMLYYREPLDYKGIYCVLFREMGFEQAVVSRTIRGLMCLASFLWGSIIVVKTLLAADVDAPHDETHAFKTMNVLHTLGLVAIVVYYWTVILLAGYSKWSPVFWQQTVAAMCLFLHLLGIGGILMILIDFNNKAYFDLLTCFQHGFAFTFVIGSFITLRVYPKWFWLFVLNLHPGLVHAMIFLRGAANTEDQSKKTILSVVGYCVVAISIMGYCATPLIYILYRRTVSRALETVSLDKARYDEAWTVALQSESASYLWKLYTTTEKIQNALTKEIEDDQLTAKSIYKIGSKSFWIYCMGLELIIKSLAAYQLSGEISIKHRKVRQQSRDLDELFEHAQELHWFFQDWVAGWSNDIAWHIPGPVKHPQRAITKAIRTYDRDVGLLTDLVRCTVVCESFQEVHMFLQKVVEKSVVGGIYVNNQHCKSSREKKLRITSLKNRFSPQYDSNITQGYRDLSLGIEVCWVKHDHGLEFLPVGDWARHNAKRHICEIQVHLHSILEVKGFRDLMTSDMNLNVWENENAHLNYQKYRDLMAS